MTGKPEERERVGATLKTFRELRGVKVSDMALEIGISRSYLANIEAGRKNLPPHILVKVCEFLNIPQIAVVSPGYGRKEKSAA